MQSIQHLTILTANVMSRSFPLQLLAREPFRLFFPAATVAGIVGVALWPLHLLGFIANYPGQFRSEPIFSSAAFGARTVSTLFPGSNGSRNRRRGPLAVASAGIHRELSRAIQI